MSVNTLSYISSTSEPLLSLCQLPWWLWILLALILIIFILCCVFYCCCKRDKQPPPIGTGARPNEYEPLTKYSSPESPLLNKHSPEIVSVDDNFDIPKPTQSLFNNTNGTPTNRVPDRPSISDPDDRIPNKEYPDNDSMDAYSQEDPDDIDRQLARGFGEERPNIMDKKTYNMLEKTSPKRVSSFGEDDRTPRSPKSPKQLTPAEIPRVSTDYLDIS